MRRPPSMLSALAALLLLAASGCGDSEEGTPAACLNGPEPYLTALRDAPGPVKLGGQVPISDCLATEQGGGALAGIGSSMLAAATKLNAEARAQLGGPQSVRLGYLIGAAQRGAEGTGGIHVELVRRLRAAALYSPAGRPPPALRDGFREGFAAGQAGG